MTDCTLPEGFAELEPFVSYWALDTSTQRMRARAEASMSDITSFYDAMLPRAAEAMDIIDKVGLDNLTGAYGRLCKLVLALGQASVAVEIHKAPRAPGTPYPNSIQLTKGPFPFG
jgi:hypothetical protein